MRTALLILAFLTLPLAAQAQGFSARIDVLTVHSQNGRFYLRSVPFDGEYPTTPGATRVYSIDQGEPLYEFERGFDSVSKSSNNLILSDDGQTIFHAIPWGANEQREGLKSITLYRNGRIHSSYTAAGINGCDKRERCSLIYSNYGQVVDHDKSLLSRPYRKIFKEGVSAEEQFLSDFALFSHDDMVYLTDSKKRTHVFNLKDGVLARSAPFDELYVSVKDLARFTKVETESYEPHRFDDFPRLKGGGDTAKELAAFLGMTEMDLENRYDSDRYRIHEVHVRSSLLRDGSLEIEEIQVEEGLPRERIVEFFKTGRFDIGDLPAVFDKYRLAGFGDSGVTFRLRNSDKRVARSELKAQRHKELLAHDVSAVLHDDRLIHLDESGRVRVWRLRDGSFDAAMSAELARDDLAWLASDGRQLWALGESNVYRWSAQDHEWRRVRAFNPKRGPVKGFAVAGGVPLLVLGSGVMNAATGRLYTTPGDDAFKLMRMETQIWIGPDVDGSRRRLFPERYNPVRLDFSPLSSTVAVLGTKSHLWIGTSGGEWGGSLRGLNPGNGRWAEYGDSLHYVTGITQDNSGELIVSWSMHHFDADTQIRRHGPNAKPSLEYPELEAQYYQTVAFNPFDSTLYGVEQRDVVTISDGKATTIADLDGPVYGKEPMALGVAPGIGKLLPFAPGALIVVAKQGMPWLLSGGKLTRLMEP